LDVFWGVPIQSFLATFLLKWRPRYCRMCTTRGNMDGVEELAFGDGNAWVAADEKPLEQNQSESGSRA
jgi:TorA maturation chaperone TorD